MQSPSVKSKLKTLSLVQEIYRPIIRGYFAVFSAYYLLMIPTHFLTLGGFDQLVMTSAAVIAAFVGMVGVWMTRKPSSLKRLEILLVIMNLLVVSNVVIALDIGFATEKLTYFIIMVMLFALASLSFRQSCLSIAVASAALVSFLPRLDSETFSIFAFLAFGAAMASLAIAFFLRKSVTGIAEAKLAAELELKDAHIVGETLRERTLSDSLTKLPNRRAFFETLRKAMHQVAEHGKAPSALHNDIWLIAIDLDGFKAVNDIHGHQAGDKLLQTVARRLEAFGPHDAHVSRMGGDEFNIVLDTPADEAAVMARCHALLESLASPYKIEGRNIRISASIGCTLLDSEGGGRSQISQADYALMVAKKEGKNRAVIFDEKHAEEANARHQIENALRTADLSSEIKLLFQPQFDLHSNTVVRAEALARWLSPDIGQIEPQRFIKIAEESGLITEITLTVVEKAFAQLRSWANPIPLSINLSSHDLMSDSTIDLIIRMAEELEISPALVEFEVTETAMMADIEKATANLEKLAALGFEIALDDFGTGYSNFSYLRALPIGKLKVDRSFLENPGDPTTEKMLSSLAGMARTLGVHCLLEGVENEIDLLSAKRVGVDSVQGFLFGKPMSSDDLLDVLEGQATDQRASG